MDRPFLQGTSPIDLRQISLGANGAIGFLRAYGYDPDCPQEAHKLSAFHQQAIDFMQRHLCQAPRPCDQTYVIPEAVKPPALVAQLVRWAAVSPGQDELQAWACAVLRVMHAIAYAEPLAVSPHSEEIQRQILDPFRRHLHRDSQGRLWLGKGEEAVPLLDIQFRQEKARDSLILKLLHKPDNLPHSVYDRVGVRLVTNSSCQALRALQYIRRHHLANAAHVTPGRSRNTLVEYAHGSIAGAPNPHSSSEFRSLQFTCQQLVKVPNPLFQLAQALGEEPQVEPNLRFFFPFEVQIFDQENDQRTRWGESSHANYRMRQIRAVRARVFPSWLRQGL
ncbi:TIGR04552 family protein [bacterium]|nr:TIGR04552 family protein [bacterium]